MSVNTSNHSKNSKRYYWNIAFGRTETGYNLFSFQTDKDLCWFFIKIPGTESVDHSRAVKAYSRPAAGVDQPLPSDVRPPRVLLMTLDYLITEIVGQGDLADSHAFVRDRTRSIRQDFTLQNSRGIEAVKAHEIIARYHILCIHQLCENKNFSLQQELEQLWNVLTSLQEFYDDLRTEGVDCPNEAEFRAYNILCHLYDPDMIRQAQSLPQHILQNPYIQVAVEVHALTRRNNNVRRRAKIQSEASPNYFSRFFKLIEGPKITYLMACLLETDFGGIRKGALKALNKSYLEQHEGFPVEDLIRILGFDNAEECILNCQEYDLEISHHGQPAVVFGKKEPSSRRRIFKGKFAWSVGHSDASGDGFSHGYDVFLDDRGDDHYIAAPE
ncbi:SAC3/GANP/Nin1/mts3/eIF-3 p25 family-domain-containing protein [Mortierella sp. GBAus27b]|nr:SAC3/GANP/Nin1/mts3/eIF-3 p25 family-domain-containing protein [Mortierella sp. GBAus27b]